MATDEEPFDVGVSTVMQMIYDFIGSEPSDRCHCKSPCIRERIKIQRWQTTDLYGESTIVFQVSC